MILLFFLTFLCAVVCLPAQDTYVFVEAIRLEGNKKTKAALVLRELDFQVGDSIPLPTLSVRLEANRIQLMNTGLFSTVTMNIKDWDPEINRISVDIVLVESWYIYPIPIFELADRNFNVWWFDYDHSFKRVNYGVTFYHFNLTGHRDQLYALLQFGFTTKYELAYEQPSLGKKQRLGLAASLLYARNKEVNYNTVEDRQQFFRSETDILLQRLQFRLAATFRPRLRTYHQLVAQYNYHEIDPFVRDELNEAFFQGALRQRYLSLTYNFIVDWRDIRPYPLHGYYLALSLNKQGLWIQDGLQAAYFSVLWKQYLSLHPTKFSLELIARGRVGLQREAQPFFNSRALGYEADYIRGYEYYVIDGLDFAYQKTSLRYELKKFNFNWGKAMPLASLRIMPVKLYLSLHNDLGYANNPFFAEGNELANSLLWGYGIGLDAVVYYDKLLQLEFSRNALGENGLFLHWTLRF